MQFLEPVEHESILPAGKLT